MSKYSRLTSPVNYSPNCFIELIPRGETYRKDESKDPHPQLDDAVRVAILKMMPQPQFSAETKTKKKWLNLNTIRYG
jgi:hypothetical protein